jgi:homopolymeric O-antigen transport system ATP-binding protein
MKPAIRVENLSKAYQIGAAKEAGYRTFREVVARTASAPALRLARYFRYRETSVDSRAAIHWALKDVSFEVEPGEVIGIIGRNGAGKSTLLKILSRITEPTSGRAEIHGRMGSLLEVGTGFHPELTGRENIFMNGSILGMTHREIARKFDEIVAFSEIEQFLETPVKRYSSGMYVRLAFAVAAHLEPEILIVDEVLAVGDVVFQRKCLGRMREVSRGGGRSVLLVSHNMAAISSLCERAVLLDQGRVLVSGRVEEAVKAYHELMQDGEAATRTSLEHLNGPYRHDKFFRSVAILDAAGEATRVVPVGSAFRVRIGLACPYPLDYPAVGVGIDDSLGQRLLSLHTPISDRSITRVEGRCELECLVRAFPLAPGDYSVKLALSINGHDVDSIERAITFSVVNAEAFGEGRGFHRGVCLAPSEWSCAC